MSAKKSVTLEHVYEFLERTKHARDFTLGVFALTRAERADLPRVYEAFVKGVSERR
jgi:hypothetical protein